MSKRRYRFGMDYLERQLSLLNKRYVAFGFKVELTPYELIEELIEELEIADIVRKRTNEGESKPLSQLTKQIYKGKAG